MKQKLLLTISVVCIALQLQAQQPLMKRNQLNKPSNGRGGMMRELDLTESQKAELKNIRQQRQKSLGELETNDNMTIKEYRSRKADILQQNKNSVQSVLTPEQKAKLNQKKEEKEIRQEALTDYRLKMMRSRLELTDPQFEKITREKKQMMQERKDIMLNDSLLPEQKKAEVGALQQQSQENLQKTLTPEQIEKLKSLRRSMDKNKKLEMERR